LPATLESGSISRNTPLVFKVAGKNFNAIEVGIFTPDEKPTDKLSAGEIGYIVTGIKEPGIASVGDTISTLDDKQPPPPLLVPLPRTLI
jgi:GTP-binding protein LepA